MRTTIGTTIRATIGTATIKRWFGLLLAASLAAGTSGTFAEPLRARIVADALGFPEGTVLADKVLYYVDYQASTVNRLDDRGPAVVQTLPGCGANGLAVVNGDLWVACYDSGTIERVAPDGRRLGRIDRSRDGERFVRPNDLVANRRGDLYFTASGDRPGTGKVFLLPQAGAAANQVAQEIASGLDNANGIALSADERILYVGESGSDSVLDYRIRADGSLPDRHTFAALDALAPSSATGRHTPDGIRTGPDGSLFVALFHGGGVWVLDAKGALVKAIDVPGDHHSNLAISRDGRDMYVTSVTGSSGRIYRLPASPP